MSETLTTQFEVETVEVAKDKIKLKGGGFYWSIWKKDIEDNDSKGYLAYQTLGDIAGKTVEVSYWEAENKQNSKYPFKNINTIDIIYSSEEDIKSTDWEQSGKTDYEKSEKDWDKINATKDHKILLQVAAKLAVQTYPVKDKFTDKDYDEIEVRTVKFNAMMNKYLGGVVMKEPKKKFSPLVQTKWDEFDMYLTENKFKIVSYDKVRTWLDNLKDPTTQILTEQLAKLKDSLDPKTSEYKSYHESLITACCDTLKTKDRLPVIQTLTNMVKKWDIGLEKLFETSENQCLDLLEEFDKRLKEDSLNELPY